MSGQLDRPDAAYEPPVFDELGSLEELTVGVSGPGSDGVINVSPA